MRCISVEQFLSVDEKVQEAILDWWKEHIEESDLVGYIGKVIEYKNKSPWTVNHVDLYCLPIGKETIPLLTEGQLREFIEDKTNCKVIYEYTCMNHIVVKLLKENKVNGSFECSYKITFPKPNLEVIEALWHMTCKVVKKEVK